ncbi:MAG: riboflavin biosynthesis protein RibF [Asticcacaulis sp.]
MSDTALSSSLLPAKIRVITLSLTGDGTVAADAPLPAHSSAAIGSFDGVHIGHQHVIESAIQLAKGRNVPCAVICFDPHPQRALNPKGAPFRLMQLSQQMRAFEALGVDYAFVLSFDAQLSGLSAEDFARLILKETLNLSHVSAGFDFQFGKRGSGHAADLVRLGETLGFTTEILPCQTDTEGHKLSSSSVRDALLTGDVKTAATILGRPQTWLGDVRHGAKLGRTIDFPTLNMELGDYLRARYGIYITRTTLSDGRVFDGVSNLGVRPTVGGNIELFETYLFDFNEEIYGQTIEVALLDFIRPEAKFESFDDMKAAISRDAEKARAYFRENT